MIFSELYGAYYNTVAKIIALALEGRLSNPDIFSLISEHAFSESVLTVLPAIREERWQLLGKDNSTPLKHIPTLPLTILQKRWLKAISLDPRMALFDLPFEWLNDVDPLFTPEDIYFFDQYSDGDDFTDENYIRYFRMITEAIKETYPLRIELTNRIGNPVLMKVMPLRLEYSEKDDKFRLICAGCSYGRIINLAKIANCRKYSGDKMIRIEEKSDTKCYLTLELFDRRNALERVMLHFAHFEKQAERIDSDRYRMIIHYNRLDETEMVIRVLSFGPFVKVIEPESFISLIKDRLKKQQLCKPV